MMPLAFVDTETTGLHTAMGDAQHEADIWDAIMG